MNGTHFRDSITLDAAYLNGSVQAVVESLAAAAAQEVEDERDRSGDAGREDDAALV